MTPRSSIFLLAPVVVVLVELQAYSTTNCQVVTWELVSAAGANYYPNQNIVQRLEVLTCAEGSKVIVHGLDAKQDGVSSYMATCDSPHVSHDSISFQLYYRDMVFSASNWLAPLSDTTVTLLNGYDGFHGVVLNDTLALWRTPYIGWSRFEQLRMVRSGH